MMPMRLGVQVNSFTWPGGPQAIGTTLSRVARNAESAGLSSLWVMDHFFQIEGIGPPEQEMLEGYTTLAFIAGQTERLELGTLVTGVTYRHPGILLKTVSTLDVLSGGRAWLGIGAAWNEQEHVGLGVPYPPLKTRFEQLEEVLQLAHQMFAGDDKPFEGKHFQLQRALNSPLPVRRPPIMVGGMGEQKTLRLVARYADACNFFDVGPQKLAEKIAVLHERCAEAGRDPAEVQITVLTSLAISRSGRKRADGSQTSSVDQTVERFGALRDIGVDLVQVSLGDDTVDDEVYPLLGQVQRQLG